LDRYLPLSIFGEKEFEKKIEVFNNVPPSEYTRTEQYEVESNGVIITGNAVFRKIDGKEYAILEDMRKGEELLRIYLEALFIAKGLGTREFFYINYKESKKKLEEVETGTFTINKSIDAFIDESVKLFKSFKVNSNLIPDPDGKLVEKYSNPQKSRNNRYDKLNKLKKLNFNPENFNYLKMDSFTEEELKKFFSFNDEH
jgi:hypothetical protein